MLGFSYRLELDAWDLEFKFLKKIYLDYAATTPVDSTVLRAMQPYFNKRFGNAGSLHSFGQEASTALDESREAIAKAIGVDFREIIFTSGATEANNLALRGVVRAARSSGKDRVRIIASLIEHESILETCRDLEKDGVEVVYLPANREGIVDLKQLEKNLDERTVLVSVMTANNEIGALQSIEAVAKIISGFKKQKPASNHQINQLSIYPLLHTDAVQAFQYIDIKPKEVGVDLMTISSHKIYGPKGSAALYARDLGFKNKDLRSGNGSSINHKSYFLNPIVTGGGQEFGLRSGTENIPAIVGFAKAIEIATSNKQQETRRISGLRDYFWQEIKKIYPKAELNGPAPGSNRLPNNLNIYFPKKSAEDLLIKFDMAGIAVSAGSACSARSAKPSHVLEACGFKLERVKSSLRFTLGRPTTKEEINDAVSRIEKALRK